MPEKVRLTASEMGRRAVQKRVGLIVPRRGHPRMPHNSQNVLLEPFLMQKKAAHRGGFSYTRLVMVYCAALFARSSLTFSVSFGTIWNRSPTIPTSATLKIGASGSLLMAMM